MAWELSEVIHELLVRLDLVVGIPKCNKSIIEVIEDARMSGHKHFSNPLKKRHEGAKRQYMTRALDQLGTKEGERAAAPKLPYTRRYGFESLGIIVGCQWVFQERVTGLRTKIIKRLSVSRRVANATWVLEARIFSIAGHAFPGSVIDCWPSVYGTHCSKQTSGKTDSAALNKVARNVIGRGITVRREVMHVLSDSESVTNHYF